MWQFFKIFFSKISSTNRDIVELVLDYENAPNPTILGEFVSLIVIEIFTIEVEKQNRTDVGIFKFLINIFL